MAGRTAGFKPGGIGEGRGDGVVAKVLVLLFLLGRVLGVLAFVAMVRFETD